jgi:hypothetical protein
VGSDRVAALAAACRENTGRSYIETVSRRADLQRLRQLARRNSGLKRAVESLAIARAAPSAPGGLAQWRRVLRALAGR